MSTVPFIILIIRLLFWWVGVLGKAINIDKDINYPRGREEVPCIVVMLLLTQEVGDEEEREVEGGKFLP